MPTRARARPTPTPRSPRASSRRSPQAQAAVDKARLDLSRTEVRAPMDGVVENADNLQIGQMAVTGIGMLSLVHSQTAVGRGELQGEGRRPDGPGPEGEDRGRRLSRAWSSTAHVQSIGAGTGSEFSLLPAQNANGNWVKVTQRVPVRIAFDGTPSRPMIAGLSVERHRLFRRASKK